MGSTTTLQGTSTTWQQDQQNQQHSPVISMNNAIDHNNKGIAYLEMGLNGEALHELKVAAQLMYSTTQEMQQRKIDNKRNIMRVAPPSQKSILTPNSFVRSTPILMSHADNSTSTCTIESATILMNMALCYHLDSMNSQSINAAIQNAITLYEMSCSLAIQCNEDPRSHQIILISLNNLGQLAYEFGNFQASRRYFDDISSYMNLLGHTGQGDFVIDRHDFMLNALVLRNPNMCAGAA